MDLEQARQRAVTIARQTGEILREGYRQSMNVETKSSAIDLVTQYDTQAERFITEQLRASFPDHRLHAEEGHYDEGHGPFTWFIDPLDGTNNFAHGFPVFAVSLALYREQQALVGVVYDPLRDECFHAVHEKGAILTGAAGSNAGLRVSATDRLLSSLLATGFPYDRHTSAEDNVAQFGAFLKRTRGVRRAGSAALDLAYVAAGRLDGHWEFKLSSWDVAAGILLVQEAGGRVTGINGQPFRLGKHDSVALVASNGHIHKAMLSVLDGVTTQSATPAG